MIELWRWQLQPGERFESAGHPPGTLKLFHVEQGELKLTVDDTELTIAEGCSAVAKTDMQHCCANAGADKLVFTMTVAELHQLQTIL
ncbi:cupin domain-containing protein [Vogesella indigofera]|uniref:cupin domain-containing protein n=1 Tax=Vogesella indigofera TaxID=45465 RepID=UPI00234F35B0|nr:cupin domain-containing protein [Vogesella indigofera]MDC7699437.1 cupin domain-containing protein [Vogesella indigofera]